MEINPETLEIEIVNVEPIDGGVQVFARAWSDGVQIGFGVDGTVDIERFRIFNPPILVEDASGDVTRSVTSFDFETEQETITAINYREDAKQALLQSLVHTITKVGKDGSRVIAEKVGNTTTTVYAGAGDGGILGYQTESTASQALWDELHDTTNPTGTTANLTSATATSGDTYTVRAVYANTTNGVQIGRVFLPFDTSGIPDGDTISSATLSVWSAYSVAQITIGLVQTSQADTSTLSSTDFDQCGSINSPTEGASRVTLTSTTYAYNDWTLNATGLGWIEKTGTTKLGMRSDKDMDDTLPSLGTDSRMGIYYSEATGTTNDPKLVVEHATAASTFTPRVMVY